MKKYKDNLHGFIKGYTQCQEDICGTTITKNTNMKTKIVTNCKDCVFNTTGRDDTPYCKLDEDNRDLIFRNSIRKEKNNN
jgi:hypothetical protein